jgi:hypothetical protein
MTGQRESKSSNTASVMIAVSVSLLALPSAVLAFTADFTVDEKAAPPVESAPAVEPGTAFSRALAIRSLAKGKLFPFTPAGVSAEAERSVTVAVRVDPAAARAITVRGRSLAQQDPDTTHLGIAPTGFSLGISRGYRNFADTVTPPVPRGSAVDLPDLHKFSLAPSAKVSDSPFSPHISMDDKPATGRAPRTFAGDGSELDLGGAYRVAKNFNVTAGVRYSQERERLNPLTDGKQDSQAVYVGTQFSF